MPRNPTADEPLIWLRPDRAPRQARAARPALDRGAITRAAVALADEAGLDAVSMRRIAARLDAAPMSLYWYVSSKDDLYELMFDHVIGEVPLPRKRSGDWRSELAATARAMHKVLRRHSWAVLLGIQPGLGPNTRAWGRATLQLFAGHDLELSTQINILAALDNYLLGFVHREVAWEQLQQRSGRSAKEWRGRLEEYVRQAGTSDAQLGEEMSVRFELHGDASFEFGLSCLLDGIAARLPG